MPIDQEQKAAIRLNLQRCANGEKPRPIDIGQLTETQFAEINAGRQGHGLPIIESAVIVYVGKHHYESRSKNGYSIEDMILQLESGLSEHSIVTVTNRMTRLQNKIGRHDGHGNFVMDAVIFELTVRWPKAEAFSAIPYGDNKKPLKRGA